MSKHTSSRTEQPEPTWLPIEAFMLLEKLTPSDLIRLARQGLLPRIEYAGERPFVHIPTVVDWRMLAQDLNGFRRLSEIEIVATE